MNETLPPLGEADLHAWIDGRLAAEDAARVQQALEADPALAALAQDYRRQNEALRERLEAELDEPVPARLVEMARGPDRARPEASAPAPANRHRFAQAAALLAAVTVGIGIGWLARDSAPGEPLAGQPLALPLVRAAAVAHAAYVPEIRHPVEVGAAEQTHLVTWLSKRLGTALRVPNLESDGFRLVGGRLLPDARDGVAAQFMFESANGQRLTLFLRRDDQGTDTAFRFAQQGKVSTFYWLDRGFGYALSGELPRESMLAIATSVYRQFNP